MTDQPIAHTADGRPIYDNTPTVVATLAFDGSDLTIRNPWGNSGGTGDTDGDGIFTVSLDDFDDIFREVCYEAAE